MCQSNGLCKEGLGGPWIQFNVDENDRTLVYKPVGILGLVTVCSLVGIKSRPVEEEEALEEEE